MLRPVALDDQAAEFVKGVRFVVSSGRSTASVRVSRGQVEVEDFWKHSHVILAVGQSAAMDTPKGKACRLL